MERLHDTSPAFTHDCNSCVYLGHFEQDNHCNGWTGFDLYFCPGVCLFPTVVARYGDAGHEYLSGITHRDQRCVDTSGNEVAPINRPSYPLIIATETAIKRGLLKL